MATKSYRLTKNDISIVRKEVLPAASQWLDLGLELHLDPDYLNTLKSKTCEESLRELLLRWLSGVDPEPTWKALCEALRNPAIKHELLAEEIEIKYCKVELNNAQEEGASEEAVMPIHGEQSMTKEDLQAHSETNVLLDDHTIISSHSTPTIESISLEVAIQDSPKSSSTKHVTSTSNKSPHKPKYGSMNTLGPPITNPHHHGWDQADVQLPLGRKPGPHPEPLPASYKQSKLQESQDKGINDSSRGLRVVATSNTCGDHADVTDATKVAIEPNGDQIKGTQKLLKGGGKSGVHRRSKRTRHRYLSDLSGLETGDRKMSLQSPRSKSLSVPQWTTAKYQGFEYNFINEPDLDLFCQKCGEIANEPHQTSCCSSLLCRSCVPDGECLICQKSGIVILCKSSPDRRSNKRIQQMDVMCPNAPHGLECEWIGKLQAVSEHQQQVCMREHVLCAYSKIGCTEIMYRSDLETHEKTHLQAHLNLSMKRVVNLVSTVKEMQEQLKQHKSAIDSLTAEIKRLKMS